MRWRDVNWVAGVIRVRVNYTRGNWHAEVSPLEPGGADDHARGDRTGGFCIVRFTILVGSPFTDEHEESGMARVLITGTSKGIGRATAVELTSRGHEVIATARALDALEGLDVAMRLALDVTDEDSVRRAAEEAGAVDVLVNNAAELILGPVEAVPVARAAGLFDTNVLGVLRTVGAFVPGMRERGSGAVVNVSSVAGRVSLPLNGIYCATKYAVEALSEALRFELGPFGVRVALVEPGAVATGALDDPERHDTPSAAYAGLFSQLGFSGALATETVAVAVADVVEADDPPLRTAVGAAAEQLLGARSALGDTELDAMLRGALGLDWPAKRAPRA